MDDPVDAIPIHGVHPIIKLKNNYINNNTLYFKRDVVLLEHCMWDFWIEIMD